MIVKAKVISGNLIFDRVGDFYKQLSAYEGQEVEVEVRKKRKTRSNQQNRFYWSAMIPRLRQGLLEAGYPVFSDEQTHELLKLKYLKSTIINEETGEIIETLGSTRELTTAEFEVFLTSVRSWAAEYLNITLPIPNE